MICFPAEGNVDRESHSSYIEESSHILLVRIPIILSRKRLVTGTSVINRNRITYISKITIAFIQPPEFLSNHVLSQPEINCY